MTVNEALMDALVRHQIGLFRLASQTYAEIVIILNRFDGEIRAVLMGISADTTARQLEAALRVIDRINREAYAAVLAALERAMRDAAVYEAGFQGKALSEALTRDILITLGFVGPSNAQLADIVANYAVNGAKLAEYVAGAELGRFRRFRDTIRREWAAGGPGVTNAIISQILGKGGLADLSRRSLEQMIRTLQSGIASGVRGLMYQENDRLFSGVLWVSVLDTKTSDICQNLDGKVFPLDKGPRPPAHINCRSTVTPIVKDWQALGLSDLGPGSRASMTGEVPETLTYPEWLARQTVAIQDEVLGPKRGKLFRDGMDLDRFTDPTGRRYTLKELARREGVEI